MFQHAHLWRESSGLELVWTTGLNTDLALKCRVCGVGERGYTVESLTAISTNTSLPPLLAPVPVDVTEIELTGLKAPIPGTLVTVPTVTELDTWGAVPLLLVVNARCPTEIVPTSRLRVSQAVSLWAMFPLLRGHKGRPSRDILLRNRRAACLRRESLVFLMCSLCDFVALLLAHCILQAAVAILLWNDRGQGECCRFDNLPRLQLNDWLRP